MDSNPLDSLLDLEEQFYNEGYALGAADGAAAGYTEGSVFAVEKGFEKFVEMGRLYGKALVWAQRLELKPSESPSVQAHSTRDTLSLDPAICKDMPSLPPHSTRLARNLQTLLELVDPATLDMSNEEEAVNDVDERLKGAATKAKLIQRAMGEREDTSSQVEPKDMSTPGDGSGSIEDISSLSIRH
ncbi:uncharacterized protein N7515_005272 [Penicillium bovifimosum]|uniref:Essential protein Yae1 N-terminal domain-containing protein n=1 Tax=Penicillium bovifimosum TaxID=126998 RepID=A0A9W9GST5_9EURO|nr:uncharacterized protein N7515_005272 [Penicillium bovifimosum]KAJ5129233.1 hypothetical protein N7515_005272 [Penicillium bovifimosum]